MRFFFYADFKNFILNLMIIIFILVKSFSDYFINNF